MSSKHGTCDCKGDKYAKASLGIQIFFLVVLVGGIILGVVIVNYMIPYFNQLGNLFSQLPAMP